MSVDFYAPEAHIVNEVINNKPDKLLELFNVRTKRWKYPYQHEEGYTIGTFDDLCNEISCETAFRLISTAVDIALQQEEKNIFTTALSLLNSLIAASKTTEISPHIAAKLKLLEQKIHLQFHNKDSKMYWDSIKKWYRLQKFALRG